MIGTSAFRGIKDGRVAYLEHARTCPIWEVMDVELDFAPGVEFNERFRFRNPKRVDAPVLVMPEGPEVKTTVDRISQIAVGRPRTSDSSTTTTEPSRFGIRSMSSSRLYR